MTGVMTGMKGSRADVSSRVGTSVTGVGHLVYKAEQCHGIPYTLIILAMAVPPRFEVDVRSA